MNEKKFFKLIINFVLLAFGPEQFVLDLKWQ